MKGLSHEEIRHHVAVYRRVFLGLGVLTAATVAVSYLRLPVVAAILVALFIATFKGSLVAGFFMHLAGERRIIFWVLALTVFFFLFLLVGPTLSRY
jgi:cytochrome c oxidase subunit 4